jgi:hypothetical protein
LTEEEYVPARAIITKLKTPVILQELSGHEFFFKYWSEQGLEALKAIVTEEKLARELYSIDTTKEPPRRIIKRALAKKKELELLLELPIYERLLTEEAKMTYIIAREYKIKGRVEALRTLENLRSDNIRVKSIAYGFLLLWERHESQAWKYSKEEKELGSFLAPYLEKLINSKTKENFNFHFQALLKVVGSTENF